jgi:glycine oxidase
LPPTRHPMHLMHRWKWSDMATLGIAGAGLLGRLIAWHLGHSDYEVHVFDAASGPHPAYDGRGAAAFSSAGMLSPLAELDRADPVVVTLGWRSIQLWEKITALLPFDNELSGVFAKGCFVRRGSLLLAHRGDTSATHRLLSRSLLASSDWPAPEVLDAKTLSALEPVLQWTGHAWRLDGEAQIQPAVTMRLLYADAHPTVCWHWNAPIEHVEPGCLRETTGRSRSFDVVFDVRGLGARTIENSTESNIDVGQLRGVRGETVWLHASGHGLTRPVRLLHPRHSVYLAPHSADRLFVGASEIETEDRSGVSVRSAMELMGAAYSVMPALAEARIDRLDRNLRPAFPDNAPRIIVESGLIRINGLFRHGWMLAPALVESALVRAKLPTFSRLDIPPVSPVTEASHG